MIDVHDLCVDYGEGRGLVDVSLYVPEGQFVLVTGPSGCGKSTLARALAGLIPHAITAQLRGRVFVAGLDTQSSSLPELARHVGIVLQNPSSQLFHLSVAEEVAFGPRNLGLTDEQVQRRVDWALTVTGLRALRDRRPADLSGGEQQRVAIAAVLAMKPSVLILDEPTASLDMKGTRMVLRTVRRLNRRLGITVIVVEHRLSEVLPFADRLLIMDQGQVVTDGAPQELVQDRSLRQRFGLRRPGTGHAASEVPPPRAWRQLLSPQLPVGLQPLANLASRQPLLTLDTVAAGYRGNQVLQELDLTLYAGEFAAVVGENGSGKSTLARVIAGLLRPSAGKVRFYQDGVRNGRQRRCDVALLFQNPLDQLFTDSVEDEVAFGPQNFGYFDSERHEVLLLQADLRHLRARCPTRLSVGQQQRTVLAACLALQPRLLILDEPTLGQDWAHLQQLMDFVKELNEAGTAILLISHDYKLVYRYARRVLLLENGRISMDGYPQPQSHAARMEGAT